MVYFILVPKNRSLKNYVDIALNGFKSKDKEIIEARGEDIPLLVEKLALNGKQIIGMTGYDLLKEYQLQKYNSKIKIIKKIIWKDNKALFGKPVLCLLGPKNKNLENFPKRLNICINKKYKNISKKYLNLLEEKGFSFDKTYVSGSTETVYNGISDLIIDIVYTGNSMKNANLKIYDKIMESDFLIIGAGNYNTAIKPKLSVQNIKQYDPPTKNRKGKLRLDFNENTIGCSPKVIEALKNISSEEISVYPEYSKFREKLASYLNLKSPEIILTNGTDEAIKVVMDTYLDKNDEIIIPTPTFAIFSMYASVIGTKIKTVLYNKDLSFPTEKVLECISSKTRIIVLVNPNNPTGTAIAENDILKIIEKARNSIILIDEAYYQYYGKTSKELIKKYDNVIITQTFSKAFGLAGLRLGYIISNKQIISNIKKVISPYSISSIALVAGSAALDDLDFVKKYVAKVKEGKKYIENELNKLGIKTFPSEANFLIANFGDKCDTIYEKLKEEGILVRNRTKYPLLKNCLRISIGTVEQSIELINKIKKIMRKNINQIREA